jgi:hypothetical protein
MATKARIEPQTSPIPVDIPRPKTLSERLIDCIDEYGTERNLDPQLLMDATARAVNNIDAELKARLRQFEDEQRRTAFNKAFEQRKAEYAEAINNSGEPSYVIKRQWVSLRRNLVNVEGMQGNIFAEGGK